MIPWEHDPDFAITETENDMTTEAKPKGKIGPVTTSSAAGTGIAGAAAIVIVWLLGLFGIDMPTEVAAAIAVLLGAVGTLVGGKVVTPENSGRRAAVD